MAQVTYRGNLSAKVFPFISDYFGATVILQGQDQNFQRQLVSSEDLDKDRGIPQVYYCHNVMPSADGFQSIGYKQEITSSYTYFSDIKLLRDSQGTEVFFAHTNTGANYILKLGQSNWEQTTTIVTSPNTLVTTAILNGQSYIYLAKVGCYVYDLNSNSLISVPLAGLAESEVLGITSSSGYMIAWTANTIAWSSTIDHTVVTDPIDFTPSLVTGAGGGNVEQAKGKLVLCVMHYLGFIIYTTENIVAAVYSNNSRFPFNLREIVGSGGLLDSSLVTMATNSSNQYAYTSSGLQLISISQTQTIMTEVTDFLSGRYFEDFDESTKQFIRQEVPSGLKKLINLISDRYLVISYGVTSFTHALVYDVPQKRFGKLKIQHVNCFEWIPIGSGSDVARQSIGFLQQDGSIKTVDFSYTSTTSNGVILLGKYQYIRARLITLQEVEIENIRSGANFQLYNLVSLDGKTLQSPALGYLAVDAYSHKSYNFKQTGVSHTLLAMGAFYMSSIVLKFHSNGRR